ncbi:hypothetical protein NMG60_11033771 [Bertholletia excelsa]
MAEESRGTVVMFPFMAQSHIIPFLALSLEIEQKGYDIVFVNTPLNIQKLRQSIPTISAIRLREIPFSAADHSLPADNENADFLPYPLVIRLLEASTSLKPAFRSLLSNLTSGEGVQPLCVIADIFFGWSAEVAHKFGIFHALFSSTGGFGLACYYSMWFHLPHWSSNSTEFTLPDFPEAGRFHVTQLAASFLQADGTDSWSIFQRQNLRAWASSNGVLFNSVAGLDEIGLNYFRRKLDRSIWPIGPILLPGYYRARTGKQAGITTEECVQWLNPKPPSSVLYISFGSVSSISASQMMQLAKALDQITTNFIWVVRPPLGFDLSAKFRPEEWLPEGFTRRNMEEQGRGLIVEQWAPQVEILSHDSVGAFMTHCGWNSVLEALGRAVPLIGWPMAAEQFFNAKFLAEEAGVCVEVARGTSFEVRHQDIREKIELVMAGESETGMEMRRKAREIKEMIRDAVKGEEGFKGSSVKAMDGFLGAALLTKSKTTSGMQ